MRVKLERGGLVPGGEETSHDNGGVGYQLEDTKTHIEEEGLEVNIPIEILDLPGDYEFTGSNFAVLNDILKLGKHTSVGELSLASEVTTVRGGDNVICKRSVWDKTIRTYKGSIRQIVSAINESGACNPIEAGATVIDHNTDSLKAKGGQAGTRNIHGVKDSVEAYRTINGVKYLQWTDGVPTKERAKEIIAEEQISFPNHKFIIRIISDGYRVYRSAEEVKEKGGEIEVVTDEIIANDKGGYDYTGEAKKIAKRCGLMTLQKDIPGSNCGNCVFFSSGFCDHYKVLLPVTSRQCCKYYDDKSIRSIISNLFDAYFFPDKSETFPLNDRGGYDYSGKALDRAREADLITLPEYIEGTTCAEKNCCYGKISGDLLQCIHPKINLPVTDRQTCGWWDNQDVIRPWGKPVETEFGSGGKIPAKQRVKDWQAENPNSPRWQKKKEGIEKLSNEIQSLRLNITKGLKSDDEKEFLTSLVIAIMLNTGERVGNTDSAGNGHVGVTGFQRDQVTITGNKIHLDYIGKTGVAHKNSFSDKRIAEALKKAIKNSLKQINGKPNKFIFVTSDGFLIKDDKVNRYLQDFGITSKSLRGYFANYFIIKKLSSLPIPDTEKKRKTVFNKVAKEAAKTVQHGVATLKKHYMIPELPIWYIQKGKIVNIKKLGYYNDGGNIGDIAIEKHYMQANNVPEAVLEAKKDLYKQAEGKDNGIDDVFQQYPVEEVVFESLIPTQDFLNSDKFNKLDLLGENVDQTTPSYIIRNEGKEYVIDGHHRCVKRFILNKPIIGHIYDIEQQKKASNLSTDTSFPELPIEQSPAEGDISGTNGDINDSRTHDKDTYLFGGKIGAKQGKYKGEGFIAKDNNWRFELSDDKMQLLNIDEIIAKKIKNIPLTQFIVHKELLKYYPEFKGIMVYFEDISEYKKANPEIPEEEIPEDIIATIDYTDKTKFNTYQIIFYIDYGKIRQLKTSETRELLRGGICAELQHAIQNREGFEEERGIGFFIRMVQRRIEALQHRIKDLPKNDIHRLSEEHRLDNLIKNKFDFARREYLAQFAEIESRVSVKRIPLTTSQRQHNIPTDIILKYGGHVNKNIFNKGGNMKHQPSIADILELKENATWEEVKAYLLWLKDSPYAYHLDDEPNNVFSDVRIADLLTRNSRIIWENASDKAGTNLWEIYNPVEMAKGGTIGKVIPYKNKYGSLKLELVTDYQPIGNIRGKDFPDDIKFSINTAEKIALITNNEGIQLSPADSEKLDKWYVVVHNSPSTVAVAKIKNISFDEKIDATEKLRISPKYPIMANGGVIGDKRAKEIITYLLAQAKEKGISLPKLQMFVDEGPKPGTLLEAYKEFEEWTNNGKNPKSLRFPYEDSNRFRDYVMQYFPNSAQREMYKHYGEGKIKKEFPDYARGGKITDKEIDTHSYGFGDEQIASIKKILPAVKESLSGKITSWGSGGNFFHLSVQLKDNRWLTFNSGTGDITVSSKPIKTAKQAYGASWDDYEMFFELYIPTGDAENFDNTDEIIKSITESKFLDSGTSKKMAGGGEVELYVWNDMGYKSPEEQERVTKNKINISSVEEGIKRAVEESKKGKYVEVYLENGDYVGWSKDGSKFQYGVKWRKKMGIKSSSDDSAMAGGGMIFVYNEKDYTPQQLMELAGTSSTREAISKLGTEKVGIKGLGKVPVYQVGTFDKGGTIKNMVEAEIKQRDKAIGEFMENTSLKYSSSWDALMEAFDKMVDYNGITEQQDDIREKYIDADAGLDNKLEEAQEAAKDRDFENFYKAISDFAFAWKKIDGVPIIKYMNGYWAYFPQYFESENSAQEARKPGWYFINTEYAGGHPSNYSIEKPPITKMAKGGDIEEKLSDFTKGNIQFYKAQQEADKYFRVKQNLEKRRNKAIEKGQPNIASFDRAIEDAKKRMNEAHELSQSLLNKELGRLKAESLGLTDTEMRVLTSIHLRGFTGGMGSMNTKERLKLLNGLVERGYLTSGAQITKKGIEAIQPSYAKGGQQPEVFSPGSVEYKTIDIRSEKGIKEAEALQRQGWIMGSSGADSIQFYRKKRSPLSTGKRMDKGGDINKGDYITYPRGILGKAIDRVTDECTLDGNKVIHTKEDEYFIEGKDLDIVKKYKPMAKGGKTLDDINSFMAEINEAGGGQWSLGGAYGFYELWAKDKDGGSHRVEVGSKRDIYQALIKYRYNKKYNPKYAEETKAKGGSASDNISNMDKAGEAIRELKTTFYTLPKATPVHAEGTKIIIERDENSVRYAKDKNYLYKVYLETSNGEKYWKQNNHTWEMANKRAEDLKDTIEAGYEISERKKSKGGYN